MRGSSRVTRSLVAVVASVVVVGLVAPPALADPPPNGDTETQRAAGVMLVAGDLRAPIQSGHRHAFASGTAIWTAPAVCTARKRATALPEVLQSSTSSVSGFRHRGTVQSVYDYGSVGAAGAAWNQLVRGLARCAKAGPVSTGRMSTSMFGQTGRWIYQPDRGQSRSYTTWITVGTTIQSFEFAVPWRQRISGSQRKALQGVTNLVGTRWIEVDTPVLPAAG